MKICWSCMLLAALILAMGIKETSGIEGRLEFIEYWMEDLDARENWLTPDNLLARDETPMLARVELVKPLETIPLPVRALLRDGTGVDYALVTATTTELAESGWPCRVLAPAGNTEKIVIVLAERDGAREAAAGKFQVIEDDGAHWVIRLRDESETTSLGELGFSLTRLSLGPIVLVRPSSERVAALASAEFTTNDYVAAMMSGVTSNRLVSLVSQLSGEEPLPAGGELRVVSSRHTNSGLPLWKATEFCFEHMSALGLNPTHHAWSRSGWSGTNVVGTQWGATASNEIVVVVAHLDNLPSTGLAPGADDNASGTAGVLAAASVMSQYRFERTVRYLLVTGEEQGKLGSAVYAEDAKAAGDNIVAVLCLDMIAWDSDHEPILHLYTRTSTNPGYAGDMEIATTFVQVVTEYGLALWPLIQSTGRDRSDHASFWNQGYFAILGIEDRAGDMNPYYHTRNDLLAHLNIPYFTAFAKASVGTVAHLAGPLEEKQFDVVRVVSGDWSATTGDFGATIFHARHLEDAQETDDAFDVLSGNPHTTWLKFATQPGTNELATDSRPTGSESLFEGALSVESPSGSVTCTNRLRFSFLTPPDPKRIYSVRIEAEGFLLVTNLCDLVAGDGFVQLPTLTGVTDGTTYGWCDIATRFLHQDAFAIGARVASVSETQVMLQTTVQAGTKVEDMVSINANLVDSNSWSAVVTQTNDVPVTADNFDAGWETLTTAVNITAMTNAPGMFFRIKRLWLNP